MKIRTTEIIEKYVPIDIKDKAKEYIENNYYPNYDIYDLNDDIEDGFATDNLVFENEAEKEKYIKELKNQLYIKIEECEKQEVELFSDRESILNFLQRFDWEEYEIFNLSPEDILDLILKNGNK